MLFPSGRNAPKVMAGRSVLGKGLRLPAPVGRSTNVVGDARLMPDPRRRGIPPSPRPLSRMGADPSGFPGRRSRPPASPCRCGMAFASGESRGPIHSNGKIFLCLAGEEAEKASRTLVWTSRTRPSRRCPGASGLGRLSAFRSLPASVTASRPRAPPPQFAVNPISFPEDRHPARCTSRKNRLPAHEVHDHDRPTGRRRNRVIEEGDSVALGRDARIADPAGAS
jgi:hypothetical protein